MEVVLHRLSKVTVPKRCKDADSIERSKAINSNDRARGQAVLLEAQGHYFKALRYRLDYERNKRYTFGKQWDDIVCVDGERMTEEEYIKRQGNFPVKNNLIRRYVRNIVSAYREQAMEPICVARDRDEQKQAETLSIVLQYNMQLNRMREMYARGMESFCIGSVVVHKKQYGWRNGRMDVWTQNVSFLDFIPDTNMRDYRNWDCSFAGQIHDYNFNELTEEFAKTPADYKKLVDIYGQARDLRSGIYTWEDFGFNREQTYSDFLAPKDETKCRVIEVWRKESKPRYRCHDYNTGEFFKIDEKDLASVVIEENNRRLEQAQRNGIPEEDVPFITAEWFVDSFWYFYYLTPFGDILKEGETPYEHKSHPYVFKLYPLVDGIVQSPVADVIDQQRAINRTYILLDFISRASAKGVLMIPDECIPKDMSPEDFAEEWARFNGVIVYSPSRTGAMPQQISSNSTNIGLHEMLNIQLKFFEDIGGVNAALQGKASFAGESGSHAQVMAQNAATSLIDIFESYNEFVIEAAYKDVKTIQQYYDEKRIRDIAGNDAVVNPGKVLTIDTDISIAQSKATNSYRDSINAFLVELYKDGAISVKQMLKVGKFDFGDELLQDIESQEEQLQQGQVPDGVSPELAQKVQQGANPEAMSRINQALGV